MLDRTKTQSSYGETYEFKWQALSEAELRLVKLYRCMSDEDQRHVRRMSEILVVVSEESNL